MKLKPGMTDPMQIEPIDISLNEEDVVTVDVQVDLNERKVLDRVNGYNVYAVCPVFVISLNGVEICRFRNFKDMTPTGNLQAHIKRKEQP